MSAREKSPLMYRGFKQRKAEGMSESICNVKKRVERLPSGWAKSDENRAAC